VGAKAGLSVVGEESARRVPSDYGPLLKLFREYEKRLAAVRAAKAGMKLANLALIEEIAELREQVRKHGLTPLAARGAAAKFEEGLDDWGP